MPRQRACQSSHCGIYTCPDQKIRAADESLPGFYHGLLTTLSLALFFVSAGLGALVASAALGWALGIWAAGAGGILFLHLFSTYLHDSVSVRHRYTCMLCGKTWSDAPANSEHQAATLKAA